MVSLSQPWVYSYERVDEGPMCMYIEDGLVTNSFEPESSPTARGEFSVPEYDYTAYGNSCILGLARLGYPLDRFNAIDLQINSTWGVKDDLVLFTYGSGIDKSHVACISANMPLAHEIWECNKTRGVCGNRTISKDDPFIRGYIQNRTFDGLCNISELN